MISFLQWFKRWKGTKHRKLAEK